MISQPLSVLGWKEHSPSSYPGSNKPAVGIREERIERGSWTCSHSLWKKQTYFSVKGKREPISAPHWLSSRTGDARSIFFCIKSSFDPYDCVIKVFKHLSSSAKTGFKLQVIFYFVSQEPVEMLRHVTTGSLNVFQPFEDEDYSIVIFKSFEVGEGRDVRKSLKTSTSSFFHSVLKNSHWSLATKYVLVYFNINIYFNKTG